jgi:hypothetical protein
MYYRYVPLFLFVALMFLQCKPNLAQSKKTYDSLITVHLGNDYTETNSPSGKLSLLKEKESQAGKSEFHYAVANPSQRKIIFQGKYNRGGYVKWINDKMIEQYSVPKHIENVVDSALYKRQIIVE